MARIAIAAALLPVLLLAACGGDDDSTSEGLAIVATTSQIDALAREVLGDQPASAVVLLKPGVDAHDYEPTAEDMRAIGSADLVLRNGIGLDDFVEDALDNAGGDARLVTVTDGIEVRQGHQHEDEEADDHDDETGEGDPHVWQDPLNAKVMVANIAAALAEADPDNADAYRTNAAAYSARLDEVDAEIRALIDDIPPANRKIVTNHDAFGYFIDRYGLEFVGAVIPSTDTSAEPSAQDIADLVDAIEREGVKAIFAESSIDPKIAEQVANDTGVRIVDDLYGDSLGEPGSGAETLDGMLLANARKIAEALK